MAGFEWGDDMADLDRPDDSAEHWSAKIASLEAANKRLSERADLMRRFLLEKGLWSEYAVDFLDRAKAASLPEEPR